MAAMALGDRKFFTLSLWQKAVLFGAAYILCAEASSYLSVQGTVVTFWLPAGLFMAVLLLSRTRDWPYLLLAALPANFIFDLFHDSKPDPAIIFCFYCANIIQATTGAWLIRHLVTDRPTLATLREFFGMVGLAVVLGAGLGALIGAATMVHFGLSQSFIQSWKIWWGGNAMAILVLTPFILTWSSKSNMAGRNFGSPKKIVEAALLLAALIAYVSLLICNGRGIVSMHRSWAVPLLLWTGLRFGLPGATTVSLLLSLAMAFFTTQFSVGLTAAQVSSGNYIFPMQTVLAMASLLALIPAIVIGERDRTMRELRESEERFKKLTAAAFEGICISENGRILDVNNQFLAMFGYEERAEMIGRQIIELVVPEWRDSIAERIRGGHETIYGHELLRKDGSTFFAEAQAKTVHVDGRILRMTALRDITERKRAEETLRNNEMLFRSYFELAMVGCVMSSLEKGIFAVNDQFCRMLGYSSEELQKMTWVQLTHPDDIAPDVAQFNRVLAGEINSYTMDKRYIRKDQREVLATLSVRCVRRPDGSPDYFVGLVTDITERKQAEQALRKSEEKFSKAFQSNPNGITINEMETGVYLAVNDSFCRLFGYANEELIGHSSLDLGIWQNPADRERLIQPLRAGQSVRELQFQTRDRNGRAISVMVSAERIELDGKQCLVCMLQDITSQVRAEAESAEAQARETQARAEYTFQLIASQEAERTRIARELHDSLGQNLLLIKNRAQLGLAKAKASDDLREQFQSISEISSRVIDEARHIAHDLHPPQLDHLGLTRALRALIDNANESSPVGIKGKFDSVDDIFPIESATNIYRIVQEKLNNILKHSQAKNARVTLERDVHEVLLKIEDDGCGFKPGKNGKGMGLKNVAERVRMLGGRMKLESQPGHGTHVEITIPISAEHQ